MTELIKINIDEVYQRVDSKVATAFKDKLDVTMSFDDAAALLTEIDDLRKFKERMERRLEDIEANVRRAQEMF